MSEIKVYHKDCFKLLVEIEDASIDVIFTDPPFNISHNHKIVREGGRFGRFTDVE